MEKEPSQDKTSNERDNEIKKVEMDGEIRGSTNKKVKKIKTRVILVFAFIILFSMFLYVSYRGQFLEIIEIGQKYKAVLKTNLKYQYGIMFINFIILFISIYIANKSIKKGLKDFFEQEKKELPKLPNKSIALILSAIFSVVLSSMMIQKITLFINKAWFGIEDPIFNTDISFYIFQKPFIEMILLYFIFLIVGLTVYATIYYIICFNVYFDGIDSQTLKNSKIIKQLTRNIILVSIGIAVMVLITTQGMISQKFMTLNDDNSTQVYGAGITDVTIKLWGYRMLAVVIIISVIRCIQYIKQKKVKQSLIAILGVPIYLVVLFVVMIGFKVIYINKNELDKEKQYLGYNIEYTKNAYNIKIEENDIVEDSTLQEIQNNTELLNNVAIVDDDIVVKTLNVSQTNTGYYTYRNANINKYRINGKERLVYISPREIISGGDRTYNNKTYEYTHGYGAIITSASQTDVNGNVQYLQKEFNSNNQVISVENPRIYFGLETNNTIVTNTTNKTEFDYPTNTVQNAEYTYNGKAGLQLNFIDRLIMALKQKDINLAFSTNVTSDSKILMNRNIIQRAKAVMPYLIYDEKPYMIISDEGKLIWVLDAYTVTDKYPYSQPITIEHDNIKEQINYIRNSVKVLIDAYDGTMQFYITDKSDPIIMAYRNLYQDLFEDIDSTIPEGISKYFVYPEYLYKIQAEILERYHNVSTDVLYRGDDTWETAKYSATTKSSTTGIEQEPYYTMLKVTDSDKQELGLVLQYTPKDKQNLRAYLVGKYVDGNAKLTLYKYSPDSNILGPMQLNTLLEQDETISKELDGLNVTGTKLIKNMIMVPINNTILYIEPIYQLSLNETKSTPILKKVVVASANKVAIDDTLSGAIEKLLSQSAVDIELENTDTVIDLVQAIIKANNNLQNSTQNNDWEMIGKDTKRLQDLINKLEEVYEAEQKKKNDQDKQNIITNESGNSIIGNLLNSIT